VNTAARAFADVQACPDCLAGPGVIRQEEAEAGLGQEVLVDGDPLVRQRVDQGGFDGERGVE
jgi:hypothetical protein